MRRSSRCSIVRSISPSARSPASGATRIMQAATINRDDRSHQAPADGRHPMRRLAAATCAAALAMALAACSPDVMPVARPSAIPIDQATEVSDPPPSAQPTPQMTDACSAGGVDDSAYLLSPQDIWPQASETGQGTATYELDSDTCHGQTNRESPAAADCARAYPYYDSDHDMLV